MDVAGAGSNCNDCLEVYSIVYNSRVKDAR